MTSLPDVDCSDRTLVLGTLGSGWISQVHLPQSDLFVLRAYECYTGKVCFHRSYNKCQTLGKRQGITTKAALSNPCPAENDNKEVARFGPFSMTLQDCIRFIAPALVLRILANSLDGKGTPLTACLEKFTFCSMPLILLYGSNQCMIHKTRLNPVLPMYCCQPQWGG